jgi:hypothetical protein
MGLDTDGLNDFDFWTSGRATSGFDDEEASFFTGAPGVIRWEG